MVLVLMCIGLRDLAPRVLRINEIKKNVSATKVNIYLNQYVYNVINLYQLVTSAATIISLDASPVTGDQTSIERLQREKDELRSTIYEVRHSPCQYL